MCAGPRGGNGTRGLMAERVGRGAMAKAQAVLEPFTLHLPCMEKGMPWVSLC